jgi:predicted secreted Zn-dependent protease
MIRWPRLNDVYVDPYGTHWRVVSKCTNGNCVLVTVKGKLTNLRINYHKLKFAGWYTLVGVNYRWKTSRGAT